MLSHNYTFETGRRIVPRGKNESAKGVYYMSAQAPIVDPKVPSPGEVPPKENPGKPNPVKDPPQPGRENPRPNVPEIDPEPNKVPEIDPQPSKPDIQLPPDPE